MQVYVSLAFVGALVLLTYCFQDKPRHLVIYGILLLVVYMAYYHSQIEKFDTSLDILYDTEKNVRPTFADYFGEDEGGASSLFKTQTDVATLTGPQWRKTQSGTSKADTSGLNLETSANLVVNSDCPASYLTPYTRQKHYGSPQNPNVVNQQSNVATNARRSSANRLICPPGTVHFQQGSGGAFCGKPVPSTKKGGKTRYLDVCALNPMQRKLSDGSAHASRPGVCNDTNVSGCQTCTDCWDQGPGYWCDEEGEVAQRCRNYYKDMTCPNKSQAGPCGTGVQSMAPPELPLCPPSSTTYTVAGEKVSTNLAQKFNNACTQLFQTLGTDEHSYFLISNTENNSDGPRYLSVNHELQRVFTTNRPDEWEGGGKDLHGQTLVEYRDNIGPVTTTGPQQKKTLYQKWIVKPDAKAKMYLAANGEPICMAQIYTKSDYTQIPPYYLEYGANSVRPSLFSGGSNQNWVIEDGTGSGHYYIKTAGIRGENSGGKYLTRLPNTYLDGTHNVGLSCRRSAGSLWFLEGLGGPMTKSLGQTVGAGESCKLPLAMYKGKCVKPSDKGANNQRMPAIGRFAKYYDTPTNIFGTQVKTTENFSNFTSPVGIKLKGGLGQQRINNTPGSSPSLSGVNAWTPNYESTWNGTYTDRNTTSLDYADPSNHILVNVSTMPVHPTEPNEGMRGKGEITAKLKNGQVVTFSVGSIGARLFQGVDSAGNRIVAEMIPYEDIAGLFNIPSKNGATRNNVVVRFVVIKPNGQIYNLAQLENLNAISHKMVGANMSSGIFSIYEQINLDMPSIVGPNAKKTGVGLYALDNLYPGVVPS